MSKEKSDQKDVFECLKDDRIYAELMMTALRNDPVLYANAILGVTLTPEQQEIAYAILKPPYRVHVDSAHNVGKTFLAAALANWWYDTRDPGVVITTAPTERDIVDILWSEIRLQRTRAGLPLSFVGPRAPEMRTSDDHWAKGFTARKGESFQGRHRENMLFIFDEAEGIDESYWTTTKTMMRPGSGDAWLTIGNPTTTSSQSYLESLSVDEHGNPLWKCFNLSALNHPNIINELKGLPPPIPSAITLAQLRQWIKEWCEPIDEHEATSLDFFFDGTWYRPSPIAEARILGRRPTSSINSVWNDCIWKMCAAKKDVPPRFVIPHIGCDVARYGDDNTAIHARIGNVSVFHEERNGLSVVQVADRLKKLAATLAAKCESDGFAPLSPKDIPIKVDDTGVGGGVVDILQSERYNCIPVCASAKPHNSSQYPNVRSELWFNLADKAKAGHLSLGNLPSTTLEQLRLQALSACWYLDTHGRRVVEPKNDTKKKLGRSPDGIDAMNLAYYNIGDDIVRHVRIEKDFSRGFVSIGKTQERKRRTLKDLFGNLF